MMHHQARNWLTQAHLSFFIEDNGRFNVVLYNDGPGKDKSVMMRRHVQIQLSFAITPALCPGETKRITTQAAFRTKICFFLSNIARCVSCLTLYSVSICSLNLVSSRRFRVCMKALSSPKTASGRARCLLRKRDFPLTWPIDTSGR